jgi:hypothetical protein
LTSLDVIASVTRTYGLDEEQRCGETSARAHAVCCAICTKRRLCETGLQRLTHELSCLQVKSDPGMENGSAAPQLHDGASPMQLDTAADPAAGVTVAGQPCAPSHPGLPAPARAPAVQAAEVLGACGASKSAHTPSHGGSGAASSAKQPAGLSKVAAAPTAEGAAVAQSHVQRHADAQAVTATPSPSGEAAVKARPAAPRLSAPAAMQAIPTASCAEEDDAAKPRKRKRSAGGPPGGMGAAEANGGAERDVHTAPAQATPPRDEAGLGRPRGPSGSAPSSPVNTAAREGPEPVPTNGTAVCTGTPGRGDARAAQHERTKRNGFSPTASPMITGCDHHHMFMRVSAHLFGPLRVVCWHCAAHTGRDMFNLSKSTARIGRVSIEVSMYNDTLASSCCGAAACSLSHCDDPVTVSVGGQSDAARQQA